MVNRYLDLSDKQQNNIFYFLDKASGHELNKFNEVFNTKKGNSLKERRNNITSDLMMNNINFQYFVKWLGHINLEAHNTLFVFEPSSPTFFSNCKDEDFIDSCKEKLIDIYDVNKDDLQDIVIIDIDQQENQLIYSLAAPSYIIEQVDSHAEPEYKKAIYLAYILIDFQNKQVVVSLHPSPNLFSVDGIRKRRDFDNNALHFINYFKENILDFKFSDPEWIINALYEIVDDYFDHNNPMIDKKMLEYEKEQLPKILDIITEKEESFKTGFHYSKLKKALSETYRLQLIERYGVLEKPVSFKVFLNETGKGITSFRANARGKALEFADSYEIVTKMVENADISSIGITYTEDEHQYPYKLVKELNYFSLKRITKGVTKKEIVDNVLRQLKKYKSRKEFNDTRKEATNN